MFCLSMQRCVPAQLPGEPRYIINICDYISFKALAFHVFFLFILNIYNWDNTWTGHLKISVDKKITRLFCVIKCKRY